MSTTINKTENTVLVSSTENDITITNNNTGTSVNIDSNQPTSLTVSAAGIKGDRGEAGATAATVQADNIIQPFTDVTASNNILVGGTITADTGIFGTSTTTINDDINTTGNVTASGNISSSGTITANTFIGDGSGLTGVTSYTDSDTQDFINSINIISGSAQLASDISGSFGTTSSSLATRITNNSTNITTNNSLTFTNLDKIVSLTLVTGSYATTGSISGSFVATSASLATSIDTNVIRIVSNSNNINTNQSKITSLTAATSSYALKSNISGSLGPNGTLIRSLTATSISESFVAPSASFSTRVTANDAKTGYTDAAVKTKLNAEGVVSSSAQVSLSGFDTDNLSEGSSNLYYTDARVKTKLDTEGVLSGSAQIATDISRSLGVNETLIRSLTATSISESFVAPSSSFSTRVTTIEGNVGQAVNTNSNVTFNEIIASSLNVTSITSSIVTSSILQTEGSNIFGDALNDTHKFNGSITASGNISASGTIESSNLSGTNTGDQDLSTYALISQISGSLGTNATLIRSLTASSISGSLGTNATLIRSLTATSISESFVAPSSSFSTRVSTLETNNTGTNTGDQDLSALALKTQISGSFFIPSASFSTRVTTNDAKVGYTDAAVTGVINAAGIISSSAQLPSGIFSSSLQTFTNITASGVISASGGFIGDGSGITGLSAAAISSTSNGADNRIATYTDTDSLNGESNLTFDGTNLTLTGNITASGDISSSGTIVARKFKALGSNVTLENGHISASGTISSSGDIHTATIRYVANIHDANNAAMISGTANDLRLGDIGETGQGFTMRLNDTSKTISFTGNVNEAIQYAMPGTITTNVVRTKNLRGQSPLIIDPTSVIISASQQFALGVGGTTSSIFLSASFTSSTGTPRIGFNTREPQTDFDVSATEVQFQKPGTRQGLRINNEGNIESFNKDSATASTGSEFILNYSRGVDITALSMTSLGFGPFSAVGGDTQAQNIFNGFEPDEQSKILQQLESKGFIGPPQVGDTIGSIRWVAQSGSTEDFDARSAGEAAAIVAKVSEGDIDGISADLIFSVADKEGGSSQKMLLDSAGVHEMTGSLNMLGILRATSNVVVGNDILVSGDILPNIDDTSTLGSATKRWNDVFSVSTTTGGVFEVGLRTKDIGKLETGTIVTWKDGKCIPCYKTEDNMVMGVTKQGKDEPIVLGAEPVLVTGKVEEGDYIVTSNVAGHGEAAKEGYVFKKNLFGRVIAQALESAEGDSSLIKCMIRKM